MRTLSAILTAALALISVPTAAESQGVVGPFGAYHDDMKFGIGAFAFFSVPDIDENFSIGGDVAVFFPDDSPSVDREYFEVNVNGLYSIDAGNPSLTPWILGGLRIGRSSVDTDVSDESSSTNVALNAGGGVTFGSGRARPAVGAKLEIGDGSAWVIFAALAFSVGGDPN